MGHYLALEITAGHGFDRVYFPLESPDESLEAALERYIDTQVEGRSRNVEKARRQARAKVEDARISHPTSWYREHGLGAFAAATPGARMTPRRRRAGA
jgi:hypothetical protein